MNHIRYFTTSSLEGTESTESYGISVIEENSHSIPAVLPGTTWHFQTVLQNTAIL